MSGLSVIAISSILDRASATTDSDYRFMAIKDLHAELAKGGVAMEPDTEKKITSILLRFIAATTPAPELQELALRWYDCLCRSLSHRPH